MMRCAWAKTDLDIAYHDLEWGVPVHHDRRLFEFLVLEGAQAGLSWSTILKKRDRYRVPGIVRNRMKIEAALRNAKAFLSVQEEWGSFDAYVWRFVGGRPLVNRRRSLRTIPTRTAESDALSKDLKRRGFTFVGTTICYAFMQAVGMVNDHVIDCFRYRELTEEVTDRRARHV